MEIFEFFDVIQMFEIVDGFELCEIYKVFVFFQFFKFLDFFKVPMNLIESLQQIQMVVLQICDGEQQGRTKQLSIAWIAVIIA